MPLVEVVTIELGAAIAKSIFKFWLKDSALGENISSNLIDLLKEKTSDIFAQREGERQFVKIGDKIAENVLPLFEKEGANLDEGDQIAVAREVAKAFNGSKLSSDILTRLNLEPTQLAQYIQTSHSTATNLFSEAATSLYLRIIYVSSLIPLWKQNALK